MEKQQKILADKLFCFLQETKEREVAKSLDIRAEFWGNRDL